MRGFNILDLLTGGVRPASGAPGSSSHPGRRKTFSLSDLLAQAGDGAPQGGGPGLDGLPPQLELLFGGLEEILGSGGGGAITLSGDTKNDVNGKTSERLLGELEDLVGTLEDAVGLYATEVAAIRTAFEDAVGRNLGELRKTVKVSALISALDSVYVKTGKLKDANADNSALAKLEVEVAQTIADWTDLQEFDADSEELSETFKITVKGRAKNVREVIAKLQAIVDEEHDRIPVPGLEKLIADFPGGTFTFETSCPLGGLTVLSADGSNFAHEHLDADNTVLRRKLLKAGLTESNGETVSAQVSELAELKRAQASHDDETSEVGAEDDVFDESDEDFDDEDFDDEDFDDEDLEVEGDGDSDVRLAGENDGSQDTKVPV